MCHTHNTLAGAGGGGSQEMHPPALTEQVHSADGVPVLTQHTHLLVSGVWFLDSDQEALVLETEGTGEREEASRRDVSR